MVHSNLSPQGSNHHYLTNLSPQGSNHHYLTNLSPQGSNHHYLILILCRADLSVQCRADLSVQFNEDLIFLSQQELFLTHPLPLPIGIVALLLYFLSIYSRATPPLSDRVSVVASLVVHIFLT